MLLRTTTPCWSHTDPLTCPSLPGTYAAFSPTYTLFSYYYRNWVIAPNSIVKLQLRYFIAWVITVPNWFLRQMYTMLSQCVCKVTCYRGPDGSYLCAVLRQSHISHQDLTGSKWLTDWCYLKTCLHDQTFSLDDPSLGLLLVNHSKLISMWVIYAMAFPITFKDLDGFGCFKIFIFLRKAFQDGMFDK